MNRNTLMPGRAIVVIVLSFFILTLTFHDDCHAQNSAETVHTISDFAIADIPARAPRSVWSDAEPQINAIHHRVREASPIPQRDPEDVLSYFDEDALEYFMSIPNDFEDHSYYTRFTAPEAPFQLLTVEILLFNLFDDAGTPGMRVTICEDEDDQPAAERAEKNLEPDAIVLNDADGRDWTVIDFEDENLIFNGNEDFHVLMNLISDEETDTLCILMDNGENQPTDRSGLYSEEDESWVTLEEILGLGYNWAIRATVRYGEDLEPVSEIALSRDAFDFGGVQVGEQAVQEFSVTNVGSGYLDIDAAVMLANGFTLNWTPPEEAGFADWQVRVRCAAGAFAEDDRLEGVVLIDGDYYVSGGNNRQETNNIYVFNRDGELIRQFEQFRNSVEGMKDLTWDGELIWGADGGNIYGFTTEGDLVMTFDAPADQCRNLAWDYDRELLWVSDINSDIWGLDSEGEIVMAIDRPGGLSVTGMGYRGDDPDNCCLYLFSLDGDNNQQVSKVNIENGEAQFVADAGVLENYRSGGCDIVYNPDDSDWLFIGLISGEPDMYCVWQIDHAPGLPPNRPLDLEITFLPDDTGEFMGIGVIASNDLDNPEVEFAVSGVGVDDHEMGIVNVPDDYPTIQMALNVALDGDTIIVQPGEYHESLEIPDVDFMLGSQYLTTDVADYISQTVICGVSNDFAVTMKNHDDAYAKIGGLTIGCALDSNVSRSGSGILCQNSLLKINHCIINGNVSDQDGGGVFATTGSEVWLRECLITNNAARNGGGVYCLESSTVTLLNCTVYGNQAQDIGGGICTYNNGDVRIVNSILWGNSPIQAIFSESGAENELTIAYSDVQEGRDGISANNRGDINWLEGNIGEDPAFEDAESNDFHLNRQSPCIDVGTALFVLDDDTLLYVAEGDYIGENPDMGVLEFDPTYTRPDEAATPAEFNLSGNYPNPFNSTTTVHFSLSQTGQTRLDILDQNGRTVATLLNQQMSPGSFSVNWLANDFPSGIYFARLASGGQLQTAKMVLLR